MTEKKKMSIGDAIRDLPVKPKTIREFVESDEIDDDFIAKINSHPKLQKKTVDESVKEPILGVKDHDDWWLKAHKARNSDTWHKIQRWD